MANPFDQFDAASSGNPFDQFDAQPGNRAEAKTWADVPTAALQNAPASAANFASNTYDALRHPLTTIGNMADVAAGGLRAGAKAVLPESVFNAIDQADNQEAAKRIETKANAVGQMLKNRYGSENAIKNTLATDPVGAAADLSAVLTGGETLAGRLPGMAGQMGRAAGAVGSAVDPLNAAATAAGRTVGFVGNRAADALGVTTGVGGDVLRAANAAGQDGRNAFWNGMFRPSAQDVVDSANQAMQQKYAQRSADYLNDTANLRNSQATVNPTTPLMNSMVDAEKIYTGSNGFIKDKAAKGTLDSILDTVTDWQSKNPNPTPLALDDLKQSLGVIREGTDAGTRSYKVADTVYKSVEKEINAAVPDYSKAMKGYADASQNLQQLSNTMSLKGPNTNTDTAARKLLSGLRNNVNTNFGQRQTLLNDLNSTNPNLVPTLAGMAASSWAPRGLAAHLASGEAVLGALHNPAILLGLPLTSPALMGAGAYGVGRAVGATRPTINAALPYLAAAQQGGRIDNIPGLLGR